MSIADIHNLRAFGSMFGGTTKHSAVAEREAEERAAARTDKQREAARARGRSRTVQTNFRTDAETSGYLILLAAKLDMTKTDVIEAAVKALAERDGIDAAAAVAAHEAQRKGKTNAG